jgi:hypothetical protein
VFAHDSGSLTVLEKTTFDMAANASVPGSPSATNRVWGAGNSVPDELASFDTSWRSSIRVAG